MLAERIDAIVTGCAPQLLVRRWYGMPADSAADADGKDVVCCFRGAVKFETR